MGAAMVYISCRLQGLPIDPIATVLMMLVVFAVYNLNRKTDEDEDAINHTERYAFTKRYGTVLSRSAVGACIIAICLSILQGLDSFLITIVPLVAGVIYSVPLLPAQLGFRRLKEIPFVKSLIVAFSWAVPPTFLPICHAALSPGLATGIVSVFFFFQIFTNTVIFDVRDVEGDLASGVKTIPTILGIRRTLLFLTGINIITGALLIFISGALSGFGPALLLTAGVIYAQGYILCFRLLLTEKLLFELFADGQFIILAGVFSLIALEMPYLLT
jgi:4-hydroxybenzoate polyprenyltransferase